MAKNPDRLLVVDADQSICDYFATIGQKADFDVDTASDVLEMILRMTDLAPTVILLGLHGPVSDATKKLKTLNDLQSDAKIILLCDMDLNKSQTVSHVGQLMGLNMSGVIQKPMVFDAVHDELKRLRTTILESTTGSDKLN